LIRLRVSREYVFFDSSTRETSHLGERSERSDRNLHVSAGLSY
jgi:hypothetical protein